MKRCEKCGKISDTNFCLDCGGKMIEEPQPKKKKRLKETLNQIFDEKSDRWVRILKVATMVEMAIMAAIAAISLLTGFLRAIDWGSSIVLLDGLLSAVILLLVGAVITITNMVVVHALYNLQEIRKVATKQ